MKDILDGIQLAIEDEVNAQKHYQELADKAEDPLLKKFFEQLVKDEQSHEKVLRSRYEALSRLKR
ncbi:ferritin family protein [Desulfuribacillus alkaliarsenatis]|uniref:Rubrerythrin n=1 Tax=Desulfuribacillus alkaliarsenatis TaxID=766136 RepID=A0A1E5G2W9_9FIRM|nr:ferritin family protein [Desulfuribacillus alkaliarsenatis]OEF97422.1 rubrerythrin [Desulfuribacillus alkaliarsenatis]